MNERDFPAAHSMDTEWFAIDEQGHVGHFETGEAGSVPNEALTNHDGGDSGFTQAILSLTPNDGIEYYIDDLVALPGGPVFEYSWESKIYESRALSNVKYIFAALLLLDNESLFSSTSELPREPALGLLSRILGKQPPKTPKPIKINRVLNSQHILGYIDSTLEIETLENWIRLGLIKRAWINHGIEASRVGIFCYEHGDAFENWISGPYFRMSAPKHPLKFDSLPESLRQLIRGAQLRDTNFMRAVAVDPHDAGECSSWEQRWISLDGVVYSESEQTEQSQDDIPTEEF